MMRLPQQSLGVRRVTNTMRVETGAVPQAVVTRLRPDNVLIGSGIGSIDGVGGIGSIGGVGGIGGVGDLNAITQCKCPCCIEIAGSLICCD